MAALMLFLLGVALAVGGVLVWAVFTAVPLWICCASLCRHNAWWTPDDKIRAYVTLKNERLARLLIPEYIGWNSFIRVDIPLIFNRYTPNKYPERLSVLGLFNYIFALLTGAAYFVCITDFVFLHLLDPNWALYALFALAGVGVVFFALENWNTGARRDPAVVITRQGMKQIRAARRVKRRRKAGKRER